MVSRRSIRVKVMQLLYSLDRDPGVSHPELLDRYDKSVDLAYESLLYSISLSCWKLPARPSLTGMSGMPS